MQLDVESLKTLLGRLRCTKDLNCARAGLEALCKAKYILNDKIMLCLEKAPECAFATRFGSGFLCECPVRIYLAKHLGK